MVCFGANFLAPFRWLKQILNMGQSALSIHLPYFHTLQSGAALISCVDENVPNLPQPCLINFQHCLKTKNLSNGDKLGRFSAGKQASGIVHLTQNFILHMLCSLSYLTITIMLKNQPYLQNSFRLPLIKQTVFSRMQCRERVDKPAI